MIIIEIDEENIHANSYILLNVSFINALMFYMLDRCCLGIDAIDVISQNWRRDEKKIFY